MDALCELRYRRAQLWLAYYISRLTWYYRLTRVVFLFFFSCFFSRFFLSLFLMSFSRLGYRKTIKRERKVRNIGHNSKTPRE